MDKIGCARQSKSYTFKIEVIRSERILNPLSWLFKDPEEDAEEHVDERTATLTWVQWAWTMLSWADKREM